MAFERITIEPGKMGGQPCVRGMRVPVSLVVDLVASGMTEEKILEAYPYLEREDIAECLHFAAAVLRSESYYPPPSGRVSRALSCRHGHRACDGPLPD